MNQIILLGFVPAVLIGIVFEIGHYYGDKDGFARANKQIERLQLTKDTLKEGNNLLHAYKQRKCDESK